MTDNVMEIDGYRAAIRFDPAIGMFRGEFIGLNGGADFYANSVAGLLAEGQASLRVFLDTCREKGIDPERSVKRRAPKIRSRTKKRQSDSGGRPSEHDDQLLERVACVKVAKNCTLKEAIHDALKFVIINGTKSVADDKCDKIVERIRKKYQKVGLDLENKVKHGIISAPECLISQFISDSEDIKRMSNFYKLQADLSFVSAWSRYLSDKMWRQLRQNPNRLLDSHIQQLTELVKSQHEEARKDADAHSKESGLQHQSDAGEKPLYPPYGFS